MINEDFEKRSEAEMQLNDKNAVKAAQIKKLKSMSSDVDRIKKALEWNGNNPIKTLDYLTANGLVEKTVTIDDVKSAMS